MQQYQQYQFIQRRDIPPDCLGLSAARMLFFSREHIIFQASWSSKSGQNNMDKMADTCTRAICTRTLRIKHGGITWDNHVWSTGLPKGSLLLSRGDEGPEHKGVHWICFNMLQPIPGGNDVIVLLKFRFNDKSSHIAELEHYPQPPPDHPSPAVISHPFLLCFHCLFPFGIPASDVPNRQAEVSVLDCLHIEAWKTRLPKVPLRFQRG